MLDPSPTEPAMVIGILQFDLLIHGAQSLKDKRRVVLSVKDRLHREHLVSVAEVDKQDMLNVARLGLALVGADSRHVGQTLDRIVAKLRAMTDAELGDVSRQVLHGEQVPGEEAPETQDDGLADEMFRRFHEAGGGDRA